MGTVWGKCLCMPKTGRGYRESGGRDVMADSHKQDVKNTTCNVKSFNEFG